MPQLYAEAIISNPRNSFENLKNTLLRFFGENLIFGLGICACRDSKTYIN